METSKSENMVRSCAIAPNELSVADVDVTKQLYGHGYKAAKTGWYSTLTVPDAAPSLFAEGQKALRLTQKAAVRRVFNVVYTQVRKVHTRLPRPYALTTEKHAYQGHTVNMAN